MNIPANVNAVSLLIVCIFILPICAGLLAPFRGDRVRRSLQSLTGNVILLISVVLAVYCTRLLLASDNNEVLAFLYQIVPSLQSAVKSHSVWVYAAFFAVLLLAIDGVLYLLALPVYRFAIDPVSDRLASKVGSMSGFSRQLLGGLWQLPTSVWLVLLFSILLHFYIGYFHNPVAVNAADQSVPYQYIEQNVTDPLLNSGVVKNIQVILNDSFKKAKIPISDSNGQPQLIRYFNGMTLDDAVKSDAEIDAEAKKIVGSETDARRKADLIYKWVSRNVKYDDQKALAITQNPSSVSSGAIVAYQTRSGVCFDYACLYVAMCRAVDVKVRFVTGLGYSGEAWGDHAWNEAYDTKKNVWINVDTTFGSSGSDYFDRANFGEDHQDAVVQGEW